MKYSTKKHDVKQFLQTTSSCVENLCYNSYVENLTNFSGKKCTIKSSFNSFRTKAPIIWKPVHQLATKINRLVSI